jgi:hypothetical protein
MGDVPDGLISVFRFRKTPASSGAVKTCEEVPYLFSLSLCEVHKDPSSFPEPQRHMERCLIFLLLVRRSTKTPAWVSGVTNLCVGSQRLQPAAGAVPTRGRGAVSFLSLCVGSQRPQLAAGAAQHMGKLPNFVLFV